MFTCLDRIAYQLLIAWCIQFKLKRIPFDKKKLPNNPGIYIVATPFHVAYVGQATDFKSRWRSHHVGVLFPFLSSFYLLEEPSQLRRTILEKWLIWGLQPTQNKVRFKNEQRIFSRSRLLWKVLFF